MVLLMSTICLMVSFIFLGNLIVYRDVMRARLFFFLTMTISSAKLLMLGGHLGTSTH